MAAENARSDPAFDRLLAAVALGEGFQFHLVTAQGPRQVRGLLNGLAEALPARRGGTARGVYLAPYEALPRDRALAADALMAHIDSALNGLRPVAADERLIVALDATPASEEDAAAWRRLFRHMNEQRNGFISQLDSEFLLCLPPWLEAPFAHEAADFWSIRGVSVTLAPEEAPRDAGRMPESLIATDLIDRLATHPPPSAAELDAARAEAEQTPQDEWRQRTLMLLLDQHGDASLVRQGDSAAALAAYTEALAIAATLAARNPANSEWQRDLSVSHDRIGDVLLAQGDAPDALAAYSKGLAFIEAIAARDPANTQWQRDLSVSHDKIGGVLVALGDAPGALAAYRKSLVIRETLAAHDPANTLWQRDLSVSHNMIGNVLVAQGDDPGALAAFRKGLAIREALVARDPVNTLWQRDLSVSHNKIGDMLLAQGDGPGALAAYRKSLTIGAALAMRDPANAEWQRDLSVSHNKIGDALRARGDAPGALAAFRTGLTIAAALATRDPANAEWQRDLIVSHVKLADTSGDKSYAARALAIAEDMHRRGILAQRDAWMIEELNRRAKP